MAKHKRIKRKGSGDGTTLIASNKRARRDYDILDTNEAGLMRTGSEVKSLREGNAQIGEGYGRIEHGEAWLDGTHIPPYTNAIGFGAHDPARRRKLLLHRAEIAGHRHADVRARRHRRCRCRQDQPTPVQDVVFSAGQARSTARSSSSKVRIDSAHSCRVRAASNWHRWVS